MSIHDEACIACSRKYYGSVDQIPLCKDHWDAVQEVDSKRREGKESAERLMKQLLFKQAYPSIPWGSSFLYTPEEPREY